MWSRYVAEFSGTFLMVLLGCGSIALGWSPLAVSITFGVAVFTAIMIFQPNSGAHINPAVSIAFAANGNLEREALPGYIIAQCLGGWAAALIVLAGHTTPSVSTSQSWGIEIAITLLLMYSIHVLVRRKVNLFYLALGVGSMVGILNTVGAVFGTLSPLLVGLTKDFTGDYIYAYYILTFMMIFTIPLVISLRKNN